MIRTITEDDASAVVALTVAAELFSSQESEIVQQMMARLLRYQGRRRARLSR